MRKILSSSLMAIVFSMVSLPTIAKSPDDLLTHEDLDIRVIAQMYAEHSGSKVVIDPRVRGKATLLGIDPKQLTYDEFATVLATHNFFIHKSGEVLVVLPRAISKLYAPFREPNVDYAPSDMLTEIIQLEQNCPNQLIPMVRPKLSPVDSLDPLNFARAFLITSTASNIERIRGIIAGVEQATPKKQTCKNAAK